MGAWFNRSSNKKNVSYTVMLKKIDAVQILILEKKKCNKSIEFINCQ